MTAARIKAVAIGASAGAVEALLAILPRLPAAFAAPVFVVVHVPPDRDHALVSLMEPRCAVTIKEAEDKEAYQAGTVYFAPADYHLLVETGGTLALSSDELVNYSRPAIDVLFESAAHACGSGLLAIVLTGANSDGAEGLRLVDEADGQVLVQDPATATAAAMPQAALKACPGAAVQTLDGIVATLLRVGAAA